MWMTLKLFLCLSGEKKEGGWDWEQKKTTGRWPQTTAASQGSQEIITNR